MSGDSESSEISEGSEGILPDMTTWRSGGLPSDIVVEIGDRTFDCHRDALRTAGGYFRDQWKRGLPKEMSKIVIPEEVISADAFEHALTFIYEEKISAVTTKNVYHRLRAADFLKLPQLLEFYEDKIQKMLPCSFMFDAMTFARTSGRERLWEHIADYVSHHLERHYTTFEFLELPFADFILIIEVSPSCENVLEAVVEWIKHHRGERWRYFSELSRSGMMMRRVSSSRLKSVAQSSILPDEIPQEEVQSFLDSLERKCVDKTFIVVWGSPLVKPSPRKRPSTTVVEVSINQSIQSRMIQTDSRIARMKSVAFDESRVYSLHFALLQGSSNRRGILEFFSHKPGAMELERNQLTPPSTRVCLASHYTQFQMCGLRSTKRIYLWADCAKDLSVYDCDANQWETLYFGKALEWASMTACETNNAVYLLGGDGHSGAYLFALDPSTKEWSDLSQTAAKKYTVGTEMCALNGKLYIYRKIDRAFAIYNPKTNEWADSCKNPYANTPPIENVKVYGDELWLFGAASRGLAEKVRKQAYIAYRYRPQSNSWRRYSAMIPAMKKCERNAGWIRFRLLDAVEL